MTASIDLVQLRTFVAVAEEQHLTRASERLHVSQSAASAHVRAIEEMLDTQLFIRTNRSLELTKAGQLLSSRARALLHDAADFLAFARELRGQLDGHLIVGTSTEPETRIDEIIGGLRARHPLVTFDLCARTSASGRQGLRSGELDVCFLLGGPVDPGLTHYELSRVHFRLVGPAAWRERIEHATASELASMPWIVPSNPNSAYSGMFASLFGERGVEMNIVATFDSPALARIMLQSGLGLMLLREEHVRAGIQNGSLVTSPLGNVDYALSLAHQASRSNDPLVKAFVDVAGSVWPGIRPSQVTNP